MKLRLDPTTQIALFTVVTCLPSSTICAQQYTAEELHKHFRNESVAYEMKYQDKALRLREQPLMHWSNPERNQEQGSTFVWTKDGVPAALVSIFTFEYDNRVICRHEVISLVDGPMNSTLHGVVVWTPRKKGVDWKHLSGAPKPAASAARRLFQMRTLARQFSATLHQRGRTDKNLTLIPQPLYRYQSESNGVIEGAIFSLAVATDPELLILIEAIQSKNEMPKYRYGIIRSNYNQLIVKRQSSLVKEIPAVIELESTSANQSPWASDPFFVFFPPAPLPQPGTIQ